MRNKCVANCIGVQIGVSWLASSLVRSFPLLYACKNAISLARPAGFEPATGGLEERGSVFTRVSGG